MNRPFKLNAEERRAFRWVRDRLRSGKIKHLPKASHWGPAAIKNRLRSVAFFFNMELWATDTKCGTVCCVGGWVEARLGRPMRETLQNNARDLLHPWDAGDDWSNIKPAQAARAIDNYLECGAPNWKRALRRA